MNNRILRYILMKKEKEMGVSLEPEQEKFYNEMELAYNNDASVKNQIDRLLGADSLKSTYDIMFNNNQAKEENIVPFVPDTKEEIAKVVELPSVPEPDDTGRQLVKRAGFVDALLMALVTGFIGGIATSILFILVK